MSLYSNIRFHIVSRNFYIYSFRHPFRAETNSVEFIRKGELLLLTDGHEILLKAPVLFWMKRGHHYRFSLERSGSGSVEHLYFDFSGPRSDQVIAELDRVCPEGTLIPADPGKVSGIFLDMLQYYRKDPVFFHPELAVCAENLILMMLRFLQAAQETETDDYGIRCLAEDIRSDPFRTFDFRKKAEEAGISYEHFRKLFCTILKMPPKHYVQNQQMSLAAEMLRSTPLRIKEIMFACRRESLMDFSRTFKRCFGFSPTEYRKRFQK